jgi:RHS repeat-associated protein
MHAEDQSGTRFAVLELVSATGRYYYRARYYDPSSGRFLSEDNLYDEYGTSLYQYVRNSSTNSVDPYGLYTMMPQSPPVPPPSPALDRLLKCMEGCIHDSTGVNASLVVSSTTDGIHKDPGHALGTSVDILPPAGIPAGTAFCCAGKCGAARGVNESPANGGHYVATTTGANYHLQLASHLGPGAIPNGPECKPGASCPAQQKPQGPPLPGGGSSSSFWDWLLSRLIRY